MGEARKKVKEHTVRLKEEHRQWREVVGERKEQQKRAESNSRRAAKGELVVKEDRRWEACSTEIYEGIYTKGSHLSCHPLILCPIRHKNYLN